MIRIRKAKAKLENEVLAFCTSPGQDEPSQLAQALQAFADMIGRSIAAQLKMTLMNQASQDVRSERALRADIGEAAIQEYNPMISGLMNSVPGIRRSLRKNPGLMDLIISQVIKNPGMLSGSRGPRSDGNSQIKFNL